MEAFWTGLVLGMVLMYALLGPLLGSVRPMPRATPIVLGGRLFDLLCAPISEVITWETRRQDGNTTCPNFIFGDLPKAAETSMLTTCESRPRSLQDLRRSRWREISTRPPFWKRMR